MNDAFHGVRGYHALDEVLVAGIADEQRNALGQELGEAGGQVVDHDDAFAGLHQRLNHVTSDIAGTAGNKHAHELTRSPIWRRCYPGRGEEWVSAPLNWPLCLMLRIEIGEPEPDVAIENISAADLQLIVPNLHRRYSGVTATNRMVAPKLAQLFRAAWLGSDAPAGIARMRRCRSPETVAARHAADLACAAQQRDDRGRGAAIARLAAETGVHLGGAAAPHLDHALADPADGRDHRHQRHSRRRFSSARQP